MTKTPVNRYQAYHAHIYFDDLTQAQARLLCKTAGEMLEVKVGRFHTKLVGPHPHWSCQLSFSSSQFDEVITWLELNRNGLDILVHGVTGNNLKDHTEHASWLGESSQLNLEIFEDNHQ